MTLGQRIAADERQDEHLAAIDTLKQAFYDAVEAARWNDELKVTQELFRAYKAARDGGAL